MAALPVSSGLVAPVAAASSSPPALAPAAAASALDGAAAVSGSSSSSGLSCTSASAPPPLVPLPAHLPPLPLAVLTRCDAAQRAHLSAALDHRNGHPTFRWSRTGLPAICAWSNRVAHMLLLGAERNGGRVALRLPVACGLASLEQHAAGWQVRHVGDPSLSELPVFPDSLVTRWLSEYHELHPASSLQLSPSARLGLHALVEFLVRQLADTSGGAATVTRCGVVTAAHMQQACRRNEKLQRVREYLGAPDQAATLALSAATTAQLPVDQAEPAASIRSNPLLLALRGEFQPNTARLQALLSGAWYHNPQLVEAYAQQYARLELQPGDAHFFRQHRIRPLALFGMQNALTRHSFIGERIPTEAEEYELIASDSRLAPQECLVFAFELLDAHGVGFPFVCHCWPYVDERLWLHANGRPQALLFHAPSAQPLTPVAEVVLVQRGASLMQFTGKLADMPMRRRDAEPHEGTSVAATSAPASAGPAAVTAQGETHQGSSSCRMRRRGDEGQASEAPREEVATAAATHAHLRSSVAPSAVTAALVSLPPVTPGVLAEVVVFGTPMSSYPCSYVLGEAFADDFRRLQTELRDKLQLAAAQVQCVDMTPSSSAPAGPSDAAAIAALAVSIEEKRAKYLHWLHTAELQHALIVALEMADFSQYSLELFPNFHPPAVRAYFTATLLDRASQAAGLPLLPMDLLRIIGDYEPADLPYMPEQPLREDEEVLDAAFVDQRVGPNSAV